MHLHWLKKYSLLIFDEIDSTNLEAIRLIKTEVLGDFVVWAQSQTNGRGSRVGRVWQSEPGNLYTSIIRQHDINIAQSVQISFVAALAVYEVLSNLIKSHKLNYSLKLKWPNDILINDKKISGILIESLTIRKTNYFIIGIGINVEHSPKNLSYIPTSLLEEHIQVKSVGHLLNYILSSFDKYYDLWQKKGFLNIRRLWLKRAYKLNEVVTIDDGQNRVSGIFKDIDFTGTIRLQTASGQIYTFAAGEVITF